jgi:hypothetical protein
MFEEMGGHLARGVKMRKAYKIFIGTPEGGDSSKDLVVNGRILIN